MSRDAGIRWSMLAVVLTTVSVSWAGVVSIDLATGWQGYFLWEGGVGPIDGISESPYYYDVDHDTWPRENTQWSIALPDGGVVPYIEIWDNYDVSGDIYALLVDGTVVPPTATRDGPGTFFYWDYRDLALTAGTHLIAIDVTATGGRYIHYGSGHAYFSPVTGYATPAPGAILLGALGVGIVGWLRGRRTL
ncbi:MAG: hypothetical protein ABFE13_16625 [Phycisphaerales bacterium]